MLRDAQRCSEMLRDAQRCSDENKREAILIVSFVVAAGVVVVVVVVCCSTRREFIVSVLIKSAGLMEDTVPALAAIAFPAIRPAEAQAPQSIANGPRQSTLHHLSRPLSFLSSILI